MFLRESSNAAGESVDLKAAVAAGDPDADSDIAHAPILLAFAESANRLADALPTTWYRLVDEIGADAAVEAAQVVSIFRALNAMADATGIPLDRGRLPADADALPDMGFDGWVTAANTPG